MTVVVVLYPHGALSFRRNDRRCGCGALLWISTKLTACSTCRTVTGGPLIYGDDQKLLDTLRPSGQQT